MTSDEGTNILAAGLVMGLLQFGLMPEFEDRIKELTCVGYPVPGATNVVTFRSPMLKDHTIYLTITAQEDPF